MEKIGYCTNCNKRVIIDMVIDGKVVLQKTPQFDEVMYKLSNGTKMRICVCRECQENDRVDTKLIMDKVIKGWKHCINSKLKWDHGKKEEYLNKYENLTIVEDKKDKDGNNKPNSKPNKEK